ncbi:DMT family transporter [Shimia biformata]|uniref:DMT family transporter n=1 Tax=Shimia biformata TaxID=1294299 RepID=UPI00308452E1
MAGKQDRVGLGMLLMLGAYLLFAATDTSVKWQVTAGVGAFQLAFARYGVQFALSLATSGHPSRFFGSVTRRQAQLLALRAALLVTSTISNFIALRYLTLTVTSAIMFSSPFIVCFLAVPMLGERIGPWRWSAIAIGFVGVMFVVRPFGEEFHWAALLSLYNAFALAMFSIITRMLSGEVSTGVMQATAGLSGTVVLLPFAVWTWQPIGGVADWVLFLGIGLTAWIGHECFARAHRYAEVSFLMPLSYSYLIFMSVAGWLFFGNVADAMTFTGAGIIVISGLIIWWREKRPVPPKILP